MTVTTDDSGRTLGTLDDRRVNRVKHHEGRVKADM
jgi:hypothetical protein